MPQRVNHCDRLSGKVDVLYASACAYKGVLLVDQGNGVTIPCSSHVISDETSDRLQRDRLSPGADVAGEHSEYYVTCCTLFDCHDNIVAPGPGTAPRNPDDRMLRVIAGVKDLAPGRSGCLMRYPHDITAGPTIEKEAKDNVSQEAKVGEAAENIVELAPTGQGLGHIEWTPLGLSDKCSNIQAHACWQRGVDVANVDPWGFQLHSLSLPSCSLINLPIDVGYFLHPAMTLQMGHL
jgi:hypothetical protein